MYYNKPGFDIFNYKINASVTSSQRLWLVIFSWVTAYLYDDNHITIEGIRIWHLVKVAQSFGQLVDASAHGSPWVVEVKLVKENFGFDPDKYFEVPDEVLISGSR